MSLIDVNQKVIKVPFFCLLKISTYFLAISSFADDSF